MNLASEVVVGQYRSADGNTHGFLLRSGVSRSQKQDQILLPVR
jgi:hypothetical protein